MPASPSPGRSETSPLYLEVCKDLKVDPLKPNRLSREIDRLTQKIERALASLKELATGG